MEIKFTRLILLLLISLLFSISTYSQSISLKAGLNLSNIKEEESSGEYKINPLPELGIKTNFKIDSFKSLETGLLLSGKGFINEAFFRSDNIDFKRTTSLYYLELPIKLKIRSVSIEENKRALIGEIGFYSAIGIEGKTKREWDDRSDGSHDEDERKIEWGNSDDDDFKKLDFGVSLGIGIDFKVMILGISYDIGLSNILISETNETKFYTRTLKISIQVPIIK